MAEHTGRPAHSGGAGVDRRTVLAGALAGVAALAAGCTRAPARELARAPSPAPPTARATPSPTPSPSSSPEQPTPDVEQVLARATLPVLCYHQLRDWRPADGGYARRFLVCPPATFRGHLDALAEGGWTTVGPDDYLAHLTTGTPLPPKPVLLSFDDSQATQVTEGLPQLVARGMTGSFFAMTVVLGKRDWMSHDDLRRVRDAGMTVGAHTYDHERLDRLPDAAWTTQLDQPRELLEQVLGVPVEHLAYPYGAWRPRAFPHVLSAGYRTAFQLADKPLDPTSPLITLRRVLVESGWDGAEVVAQLRA